MHIVLHHMVILRKRIRKMILLVYYLNDKISIFVAVAFECCCKTCLFKLQVENEGETIYSGISQAIRFFCKCICFQNGPWVQSFGRLTWPRISDLIISNFLSKVQSIILETYFTACLASFLKYTKEYVAFFSSQR